MLKSIFIREDDKRLRFGWKFGLIFFISLAIGRIIVAVLGFLLSMYFAATRNAILDVKEIFTSGNFATVNLIIGEIILICVVSFFIYFVDKKTWEQIGLVLNLKMVFKLIIGCFFGSLSMLVLFSLFMLLDHFGVSVINHIEFTNYFSQDFILSMVLAFILFIFVGFQEELLFRGYVISDLIKKSPIFAVIISAIIFALMHLGNQEISLFDPKRALITSIAMLNIFLVGIIWGTYYLYTKDLWLIIGAHFAFNFFQGNVFGFNVSGTDIQTASFINVSLSLNKKMAWITGGKIGPEGGLVVTLSLIFMAAMFFIYVKLIKSKKEMEVLCEGKEL